MTAERRALGWIALAAASWGTWSLFLRPSGLDAFVTTPIMFAVVGLFSVAVGFVRPESAPSWSGRVLGLLVLSSVLDALNVGCFFGAMGMTTVARAVLSHYLAPVFVALLAPLVDRVKVPHARLSTALGFGGLVLVLAPWSSTADAGPAPVLGVGLGVLSAAAYAAQVFVLTRLSRAIGPLRAMGYHSLGSAALVLPLWSLSATPVPSAGALILVVAGALTIGALSGWVFVHNLVKVPAAKASILTFLEPVVAVAVGVLIWAEPLGLMTLLGGAMVLTGGVLTVRTTTPT